MPPLCRQASSRWRLRSNFSFVDNQLMHLRRNALEHGMGVDWHGLAMKLPQNYPTRLARKLGHSLGCGSVLRHSSPLCAAARLSACHGKPRALNKSERVPPSPHITA